jgi:hypothetical protein
MWFPGPKPGAFCVRANYPKYLTTMIRAEISFEKYLDAHKIVLYRA